MEANKNKVFYVLHYEDRFEILQQMRFRSYPAAEEFCQDNHIEAITIEMMNEQEIGDGSSYMDSLDEILIAAWQYSSSTAETYRSFFEMNDPEKQDPKRREEMKEE